MINRQNEQAGWDHPETDDWQETKNAGSDQTAAKRDPAMPLARDANAVLPKTDVLHQAGPASSGSGFTSYRI